MTTEGAGQGMLHSQATPIGEEGQAEARRATRFSTLKPLRPQGSINHTQHAQQTTPQHASCTCQWTNQAPPTSPPAPCDDEEH